MSDIVIPESNEPKVTATTDNPSAEEGAIAKFRALVENLHTGGSGLHNDQTRDGKEPGEQDLHMTDPFKDAKKFLENKDDQDSGYWIKGNPIQPLHKNQQFDVKIPSGENTDPENNAGPHGVPGKKFYGCPVNEEVPKDLDGDDIFKHIVGHGSVGSITKQADKPALKGHIMTDNW